MSKSSSILRYRADIRTLSFVAIYFAIAYTGYFMYWNYTWAVIIPWFILTCVWTFFIAVTVHNTIHCPIFTKRSWNKAYQYILSVAYGYSVSAFVPGHNFSHHKETQTAKDTMRTYRMRYRWNLLNQLLFFVTILPEIMSQERAWVKRMKVEKPEWYRQYLWEGVLVNVVKIALLIYDWQAAVIFIWIPHLYGTWGVVSTNIWQHDGCDQDHPYNHSRTFTSPILNYFTCNNGYHGAHHDKPGLHWSLLPDYHAKHIQPYLHPNLNRKSLLGYLLQMYVYPGKRVDYLGNPIVLPPHVPTEDWVAGVQIHSPKNQEDLGATM